MTGLDAAVLDFIEYLCHRFQVLTGRTNVWLAVQLTNLSIILYFVWAGVAFWKRDVLTRVVVGVFCGAVWYVLTQTILKEPIEIYENYAYQRVAKGLRNPRRLRDAMLRVSFLTLSVLLSYPILFIYVTLRVPIALATYALILLTTVILYLLACDPLPPCPGKIRVWLRGIVPQRATVDVEGARVD